MELVTQIIEWIHAHPAVLWWSGAASLVMFVSTLVIVPVLLVKMPADYFVTQRDEQPDDWRVAHPVLRWGLRGLKNFIGLTLVLVGIALLVLPGQGLLTILLGITLLDLPGKRRLEIAILRQRGVSRAVNWLRRKNHRPPVELPARPIQSE